MPTRAAVSAFPGPGLVDERRSPGVRPAADACEVLLVADRQDGTTYHFFRGWRFEAWPALPVTASGPLAVTAVDPETLSAPGTRHALTYLGERAPATARGTAAFAWSASAVGVADPLAAGIGRIRERLLEGGWAPDADDPARFARGTA